MTHRGVWTESCFPLKEAKEMVALGAKAYEAYGKPENLAHVVGGEGHRFYADIAWEALERMGV